VAVLSLPTGGEAAAVEEQILRCWRDELRLAPKMKRGDFPNMGHTETADEAGLEAALLILLEHGWGGFSTETD
jgi:hypothetical protein